MGSVPGDPEIVSESGSIIRPDNGLFVYDWKFDHEYKVQKKEETVQEAKVSSQFTKVSTLTELKSSKGARIRLPIFERDILLLLDGGHVYAMDAVCYHMGGPLDEGDIEEIGGRKCVVCPWHRYKIELKTGEGLFQREEVVSAGKRQRIHHVKVLNFLSSFNFLLSVALSFSFLLLLFSFIVSFILPTHPFFASKSWREMTFLCN